MIGTPGQPWGEAEKAQWRAQQSIKRSYAEEVLAKIEPLKGRFVVEQYGALPHDEEKYPLFAVKTLNWDNSKRTVVVTGGVHGYETSGVQGALRFLHTEAEKYSEHFNIVVAPCVSPWGYETINRWTALALDPNRSFAGDGSTAESSQLIRFIHSLRADGDVNVIAHFDLHETTDTDETVFRPALASRDGKPYVPGLIPDGFYLVGDSLKPVPELQKVLIEGVQKVTHIAPADDKGLIIGSPVTQFGVINYPVVELGLCASLTGADYVTTTEVYPDSPKVDDENCIIAQVACITSGLEYLRNL
ncbi:unnamed protein product [Ectocarpus fasciculatus]